jgi:signal transduction histidine kinase
MFALSILVLGAVMFIMTDRAFKGQVAEFARGDIAAVRDGYLHEGVAEAREVIEQVMSAPGESDCFLLQQDGIALAGNLPPMVPRIGLISVRNPKTGHEVLGLGEMIAPKLYVFAGSDLNRIRTIERDIFKTVGWLFGLALLLAVTGGALVSRSFLRRSDAMARTFRDIMDGDLSARIPIRGTRDELDQLAATINEMLDRIVMLMENLSQVTNDIAHDLRTPVSQLRQRLERARKNSSSSGDQAAFDAAIRKIDDILELFAALLRIAQIESKARRAGFASIELAPLLEQMRGMFALVAEAQGHHLKLTLDGSASIRGDQSLLVQMLSNLIENAILHTPHGTTISLALSCGDAEAVVTVSDDGPGVPEEEHAKIFQRLYRREVSRTQRGHGLGLSLVAAIAELHGATITVPHGAAPGLTVRIAFPLA